MNEILGRRWAQAATVAILFVVTGHLGQLAAIPPGLATPVWLPSGIATAAVILWGGHVAWGVLVGAAAVGWLQIGDFSSGAAMTKSALTVMVISLGVVAEPLLAGFLYKRFGGGERFLCSARNVSTFLLLMAPASCWVAASVAVVTLYAAGFVDVHGVVETWATWFVGDLAGIFAITPMILVFAQPETRPLAERDRPIAVVSVVVLLVACAIAFIGIPAFPAIDSLDFLPVPVLVFIAYRFTDRFASVVGPAVAAFAVIAAVNEQAGVGGGVSNESLLSVQVFTLVGVLTALCTRALANERDDAEGEARRLSSDLAHVSRVTMMGEIAAGMAHEYHQPLAAISNYASATLNRLRPHPAAHDAVCEPLERINQETLRAARIVDRLKAFLQKREPARSVCDPNEIVADAVNLTRTAQSFPGVSLRHQPTVDLPGVNVDAVQITQILVNLIVNSLEAIAANEVEAGEVRVMAFRAAHSWVRIYVEDNGPGMDEEAARACFDQFYSTKATGLGIGLGISRTLAEAHGGRLFAEPTRGRGARFCLELPVYDPEEPAADAG